MRIRRPSSGQERRKRPARAVNIAILLVLLSLLGLWLAGPFGYWKLHMLKAERKNLYMSNMRLAEENTQLRTQIRALSSDPSYQEQIVRKELGWVKDGELLYRFMDEGK